ncbi:MAG: hypothetical protein KatS3mg057_2837 [Herpetosiphonaceae bacterium]|nr:MAG: hypothetical protein KatS3mg057_2837 [Herpetosiphonaceae bacterium]
MAQFYDDREALATLDRLREVTIEYAAPAPDGREPGLLQALLMLGWLSSRLNWQPVSGRKLDHGTALTLAAPNTSITATLRPVMGTATP